MKFERKEGLKKIRITGGNKKVLCAILVLVLVLIGIIIAINVIRTNQGNGKVGIANPASVYCEENNGLLKIETLPNGNQVGMCYSKLNSSIVCEEWAYYNGECSLGSGLSSSKDCVTNADCVPSTCCHPTKCTSKVNAPKCNGVACTLSCESILDCNQASCECLNGKCNVVVTIQKNESTQILA